MKPFAAIWSRTTPQLATVRPGSFPLPAPDPARALRLERVEVRPGERRASSLRESVVEGDPRARRLEAAPAVIGVGAGVGGPEALPLLTRFADLCDAALGATRRSGGTGGGEARFM